MPEYIINVDVTQTCLKSNHSDIYQWSIVNRFDAKYEAPLSVCCNLARFDILS